MRKTLKPKNDTEMAALADWLWEWGIDIWATEVITSPNPDWGFNTILAFLEGIATAAEMISAVAYSTANDQERLTAVAARLTAIAEANAAARQKMLDEYVYPENEPEEEGDK
jgi:hypothetical protein